MRHPRCIARHGCPHVRTAVRLLPLCTHAHHRQREPSHRVRVYMCTLFSPCSRVHGIPPRVRPALHSSTPPVPPPPGRAAMTPAAQLMAAEISLATGGALSLRVLNESTKFMPVPAALPFAALSLPFVEFSLPVTAVPWPFTAFPRHFTAV